MPLSDQDLADWLRSAKPERVGNHDQVKLRVSPEDRDRIVALLEKKSTAARDALRTLAHAVLKFAPDLADELVKRWTKAKTDRDTALDEMLALLREERTDGKGG